jgi:hypothetical protein
MIAALVLTWAALTTLVVVGIGWIVYGLRQIALPFAELNIVLGAILLLPVSLLVVFAALVTARRAWARIPLALLSLVWLGIWAWAAWVGLALDYLPISAPAVGLVAAVVLVFLPASRGYFTAPTPRRPSV